MPCYHPLLGYRARVVGESGKRAVVFNPRDGFPDFPVVLPCSQCLGCRLDRSEAWAIRCMHELHFHVHSMFLTLTYSDEHLPLGGTLVKRHFQEFMYRLRRHVKTRVSYFQVGEYGERTRRPHYHALLFGYSFPDQKFLKKTPQDDPLYTSDTLDRLWGKGNCWIGAVTFQSAAYCARYIMKKVTGERAAEHYTVVDDRGEMHCLVPEYITMSLKPAIGKRWIQRYWRDVYPDDFVVVGGKKRGVPAYYDKYLQEVAPTLYESVRLARMARGRLPEQRLDSSPWRLEVREEVRAARISTLKRGDG